MVEILDKPSGAELFSIDWASVTLEQLWSTALEFCEAYQADTLGHFRTISIHDLTPHRFWSEYIWTVYASGFKASIVGQKFKRLMSAYGPWDYSRPDSLVRKDALRVIANSKKCDSILSTRKLMRGYGWDEFRDNYSANVDTLAELPFIGKVTKYHLGRNIGLDCVKPDLHLVRLADHFGFDEPLTLCAYLEGLSGERIGVVDFVLWAYCSTFGSIRIAHR